MSIPINYAVKFDKHAHVLVTYIYNFPLWNLLENGFPFDKQYQYFSEISNHLIHTRDNQQDVNIDVEVSWLTTFHN